MPIPVQVTRLARVRTKVRTDLWPDAPQIPETMVKRFPELKQFNEDLRRWVELVREATELDPNAESSSNTSCG